MRTAALILLALLAIGFVCEQEVYQELAPTSEVQQTEFVLVIDKSGSMRGQRLDEAKRAAIDFTQALLDGQRVAIIAFDDRAQVVHEMSNDKASLERAINTITPGFWTGYVPALQAAQDQFTTPNNNIIIFLSDGVDEEPPRVFAATQELLAQNTCIFTVAYAADAGADVLLGGMAEQSAQATNCGAFFEAQENGFDLEYVFSTLFRELSGQERINVQTTLTHNNAQIRATQQEENLFDNACFAPTTTLTIWDNGRIIVREQTTAQNIPLNLGSGTYRYETIVSERCQGNCYAYGIDTGSITIQDTCTFTEQDYFLLATPDVVRITAEGFTPRTLGTAGTVIWSNDDTRPRQVLSATGSWESPLIQPGQNWSRTFAQGTHGYTDEDGSFVGSIRTIQTTEPSQFVFVFDNSGSMAGEPLQAAKEAATSFVELLGPQDRASFIVFDQRVRLLQDAQTTDKTRLKNSIQGIRAEGFSLYIPAIELAGQQLRTPITRRPIIIFLSDGLPRDPQGLPGILKAIDDHLPGACLHIIAYITDDPQARDLLQTMADHAHARARCGAFYTVADDGQELRAVLGEIYVSSQQHLLEFVNTQTSRTRQGIHIATQVRSTQTTLYLPSTSPVCLPAATVRAITGVEQHTLEFNGTHYTASIPHTTQPIGLAARITAQDSAQTATAHTTIRPPVRIPYEWLAITLTGIILLLLATRKSIIKHA